VLTASSPASEAYTDRERTAAMPMPATMRFISSHATQVPRPVNRSSRKLQFVPRRWDIDERGRGVADASRFAEGASELVDAMMEPDWVAEEPEAHLLPHLQRACDAAGSPLVLESSKVESDGVLSLDLRWQGDPEAPVWPAVWALLGTVSESASYVRQRGENGVYICDVVTGMLDPDTTFAPHGHTLRLRVTGAD
jgi:hypothetical protein